MNREELLNTLNQLNELLNTLNQLNASEDAKKRVVEFYIEKSDYSKLLEYFIPRVVSGAIDKKFINLLFDRDYFVDEMRQKHGKDFRKIDKFFDDQQLSKIIDILLNLNLDVNDEYVREEYPDAVKYDFKEEWVYDILDPRLEYYYLVELKKLLEYCACIIKKGRKKVRKIDPKWIRLLADKKYFIEEMRQKHGKDFRKIDKFFDDWQLPIIINILLNLNLDVNDKYVRNFYPDVVEYDFREEWVYDILDRRLEGAYLIPLGLLCEYCACIIKKGRKKVRKIDPKWIKLFADKEYFIEEMRQKHGKDFRKIYKFFDDQQLSNIIDILLNLNRDVNDEYVREKYPDAVKYDFKEEWVYDILDPLDPRLKYYYLVELKKLLEYCAVGYIKYEDVKELIANFHLINPGNVIGTSGFLDVIKKDRIQQ